MRHFNRDLLNVLIVATAAYECEMEAHRAACEVIDRTIPMDSPAWDDAYDAMDTADLNAARTAKREAEEALVEAMFAHLANRLPPSVVELRALWTTKRSGHAKLADLAARMAA